MTLSALRVAIIVFPGSNCDRDMMVAIEKLTSRRPALVWHKEASLDAADLVIIPGGFSFGDYLRCGALAGRSPIMNAVLDHAARGGAVMGICNGFQILTETGMVPGVLIRNAGLKFSCRNVGLQLCETLASPFTAGLDPSENLTIPFDPVKLVRIGKIVAFTMGEWNRQIFAKIKTGGKGRGQCFTRPQSNIPAAEFQTSIADQNPWNHSGFG